MGKRNAVMAGALTLVTGFLGGVTTYAWKGGDVRELVHYIGEDLGYKLGNLKNAFSSFPSELPGLSHKYQINEKAAGYASVVGVGVFLSCLVCYYCYSRLKTSRPYDEPEEHHMTPKEILENIEKVKKFNPPLPKEMKKQLDEAKKERLKKLEKELEKYKF